MIVPITSDRGLCGGVNGAVIKASKRLCDGLKGDTSYAILGNKGEALLRRTHGQMIQRVITEIYVNPTSFALASEIAEEISTSKNYDKAHIIYNRFKSAIAYDTLVDEVESSGKYPTFDFSRFLLLLRSFILCVGVGVCRCHGRQDGGLH